MIQEHHRDLGKQEIVELAVKTMKAYEGGAKETSVYFKWTCPFCGARVMFQSPNIIYDSGECAQCGRTSEILRYGFTLIVKGV
jgi:DNA-directed RNA polymerase subunit RPC12/RpoP